MTATDSPGTTVTFSITDMLIEIGSFHEGGVVFHVYQSGDAGYVFGETHGLIAAVQCQGVKQWHGSAYLNAGATATAIGTGSANTDAIIAAQGASATNYAAGTARAYNGGGYTDWFLPSIDELNKMRTHQSTINNTATSNGGSNFSSWIYAQYWSSTQYNTGYVYYTRFYNGVTIPDAMYSSDYVRAVRAF